jgi:hypothetical protein
VWRYTNPSTVRCEASGDRRRGRAPSSTRGARPSLLDAGGRDHKALSNISYFSCTCAVVADQSSVTTDHLEAAHHDILDSSKAPVDARPVVAAHRPGDKSDVKGLSNVAVQLSPAAERVESMRRTMGPPFDMTASTP